MDSSPINYSPLCCTKPLRPSFIFRTQIKIFWWNLRACWPCIDSNATDTFKVQKCSIMDIIKVVHVTSVGHFMKLLEYFLCANKTKLLYSIISSLPGQSPPQFMTRMPWRHGTQLIQSEVMWISHRYKARTTNSLHSSITHSLLFSSLSLYMPSMSSYLSFLPPQHSSALRLSCFASLCLLLSTCCSYLRWWDGSIHTEAAVKMRKLKS